jgi:hypothetical protein
MRLKPREEFSRWDRYRSPTKHPGRQGGEATRGLGGDGACNQETDDPHALTINWKMGS